MLPEIKKKLDDALFNDTIDDKDKLRLLLTDGFKLASDLNEGSTYCIGKVVPEEQSRVKVHTAPWHKLDAETAMRFLALLGETEGKVVDVRKVFIMRKEHHWSVSFYYSLLDSDLTDVTTWLKPVQLTYDEVMTRYADGLVVSGTYNKAGGYVGSLNQIANTNITVMHSKFGPALFGRLDEALRDMDIPNGFTFDVDHVSVGFGHGYFSLDAIVSVKPY